MGIATVEISKVQYSQDISIKTGISHLEKARENMLKNKANQQQIYEINQKILKA